MTVMLSFGRYGGFYWIRGYRICFGWVALSWFPYDVDDILEAGLQRIKEAP